MQDVVYSDSVCERVLSHIVSVTMLWNRLGNPILLHQLDDDPEFDSKVSSSGQTSRLIPRSPKVCARLADMLKVLVHWLVEDETREGGFFAVGEEQMVADEAISGELVTAGLDETNATVVEAVVTVVLHLYIKSISRQNTCQIIPRKPANK